MHGIDKLTTRGVLAMIASHLIEAHGEDAIRLDDIADDGTYVRLYYLRRFPTKFFKHQVEIINYAALASGNPTPPKAVVDGMYEYALGFALSEQNLTILNPYSNPSVDDKYNIADPSFDIDALYESCDEHIKHHIRVSEVADVKYQ